MAMLGFFMNCKLLIFKGVKIATNDQLAFFDRLSRKIDGAKPGTVSRKHCSHRNGAVLSYFLYNSLFCQPREASAPWSYFGL